MSMHERPYIGDWRAQKTEQEVLETLKEQPSLHARYLTLREPWKQRFMDFCTGKKTLPFTYDPFFKWIFDPDVHKDRLSRLISSLLGIEVRVKAALPTEDNLMGGEALMILDIVVELEDGSITNVEIQKIPYTFPAERMSCYSADLVLRQYARTRGERGNGFSYKDLKKVYTIVIFEKSEGVFHKCKDYYLHYGQTTFHSGLELDLLQEYCLVCLDMFKNFPYPKPKNEQTGWLSLLATESLEEAVELTKEYPWLEEVYEEASTLQKDTEALLRMSREALHILDKNTTQLMIDEMGEEMKAQKQMLEEQTAALKEKNAALEEKDAALEEKDAALEEKNRIIEELKKQLSQSQK